MRPNTGKHMGEITLQSEQCGVAARSFSSLEVIHCSNLSLLVSITEVSATGCHAAPWRRCRAKAEMMFVGILRLGAKNDRGVGPCTEPNGEDCYCQQKAPAYGRSPAVML